MSDTDEQFELVEFELLEPAEGTALLRLAARPSAAALAGPLTLSIIDSTGGQTRFPQLPSLPGPPGLLRAAFSVPPASVRRAVTYALLLNDTSEVPLPAPIKRNTGLSAASAPNYAARAAAAGSETQSRLADAESRAEGRRLAIIELEHRLQNERERRLAAESELSQLRAERDESQSHFEQVSTELAEVRADRDQAEARARTAAAKAGTLEARVLTIEDDVARTRASLEQDLADREAELNRIRQIAETAQGRAHESRREAIATAEQLAVTQSQLTVLEQSLVRRQEQDLSVTAASERTLAAARAETEHERQRVAELEHELAQERDLARRIAVDQRSDLASAQTRIESSQAELELAQTERDAQRRRVSELEAVLADLDSVLARRGAEIELLRAGSELAVAQALAAGDTDGRIEFARAALREQLTAEALSQAAALQAEIDAQQAQLTELERQRERERTDAATAALAAGTRITELERERDEIETRRSALSEQLDEARRRLIDVEANLIVEREQAGAVALELDRSRESAALLASEAARSNITLKATQGDLRAAERRADELAVSLGSAQTSLREVQALIAGHEAELARLRAGVESAEQRREQVADELAQANDVASAERDVSASRQQLLKDRIDRLTSERERLGVQRDRAAAAVELLRAEVTRARDETTNAREQNAALFERLAEQHAQSVAALDIIARVG